MIKEGLETGQALAEHAFGERTDSMANRGISRAITRHDCPDSHGRV